MCANTGSREVVILLKNCRENSKEIIGTLSQNIIFRKAKKIILFVSDDFNTCTNVVRTLSSTFLDKSIIIFQGYPDTLKHPMSVSKSILIVDGTHTRLSQKGGIKG